MNTHGEPGSGAGHASSVVAALTDDAADKYSLLENVLELARFDEIVDRAWQESGKEKSAFRIVVKPNLAMLLRRSDVGTYTDPFLVIHLLRMLLGRGYTNLAVVESQNLYGNWFENRSVVQIASRAGFFANAEVPSDHEMRCRHIRVRGGGVDAQVPLVDLTLDREERDLGGPLGKFEVGKTWADADFRISFSKLKTHFYSCHSLAVKNIFGCLPMQDKVRAYHCNRLVGRGTAYLIKLFPIHFSIVDGYTAADGWLGVKMKAIARKTHTVIAGADLLAVDHYGASLMKLDWRRSTMTRHLEKLMSLQPYEVVGNVTTLAPWRNTPYFFTLVCLLIEPFANIMDFAGSLATGGHDDCFPHKDAEGGLLKRALFHLTTPVNVLSDVGFLRLRSRERRFARQLKKRSDRLPLLASSEAMLGQLTNLSADDIDGLIDIVKEGLEENVELSGHWLFTNGREVAFPARLSTANLAAAEFLKRVCEDGLDATAVAAELRALKPTCPELFADGRGYPYCYR